MTKTMLVNIFIDGEECLAKECTGCLELKPLSEFFRDKKYTGGVEPKCKKCKKSGVKSKKFPTKLNTFKKVDGESICTKICTKCFEDKPLQDFYKMATGIGGINPQCKECVNQYKKKVKKEKIIVDGDFIRNIRNYNNLAQCEMADILGISISLYSLIESNKRKLFLNDDIEELLLNKFNLSLEDILKKTTKINKEQYEHYVYFFRETGGGHIKIGYAKDVEKRLKQHRTYNPFPIEILKFIKGDRVLENTLHKKFHSLRIKGTEWFKGTPELVTYITELTY